MRRPPCRALGQRPPVRNRRQLPDFARHGGATASHPAAAINRALPQRLSHQFATPSQASIKPSNIPATQSNFFPRPCFEPVPNLFPLSKRVLLKTGHPNVPCRRRRRKYFPDNTRCSLIDTVGRPHPGRFTVFDEPIKPSDLMRRYRQHRNQTISSRLRPNSRRALQTSPGRLALYAARDTLVPRQLQQLAFFGSAELRGRGAPPPCETRLDIMRMTPRRQAFRPDQNENGYPGAAEPFAFAAGRSAPSLEHSRPCWS